MYFEHLKIEKEKSLVFIGEEVHRLFSGLGQQSVQGN